MIYKLTKQEKRKLKSIRYNFTSLVFDVLETGYDNEFGDVIDHNKFNSFEQYNHICRHLDSLLEKELIKAADKVFERFIKKKSHRIKM